MAIALEQGIKSGAAIGVGSMLTNLPKPTLFIDTIYFQEAKTSSEIENIIATNDDLYKSFGS